MNARLPLNKAQERRVSIMLRRLEDALDDLRGNVAAPKKSSLLTDYEEPVEPALSGLLGERISRAEAKVEQMARDLDLPKSRSSILRWHLARLQLLSIDLYGILPSSGLRGYGEVAPATARYLEDEIPKLEGQIKEIVHLLEGGR